LLSSLDGILNPFCPFHRMEILASGGEVTKGHHMFLLTRTANAKLPAMAGANANMNAAPGENGLLMARAPRTVEQTLAINGTPEGIGASVWRTKPMDLAEDVTAIQRTVCPLRLLAALLPPDHAQNEKGRTEVKMLLRGWLIA
jgi:hypothetical protein